MFPFSEIDKSLLVDALAHSGMGITMQSTAEQIYAAFKNKYPAYITLYDNGSVASGYSIYSNYKNAGSGTDGDTVASGFGRMISQGGGYAYTFIRQEIDLSPFKTLYFNVYISELWNGGVFTVGVANGIGTSFTSYSKKYTPYIKGQYYTASIDVSNLIGSYYIGASVVNDGCSVAVKKIRLDA